MEFLWEARLGLVRKRLAPVLVLAFVAILPRMGFASAVDWLYVVDVPVAERSARAVASASAQALEIMLLRISGVFRLPPDDQMLNTALASPQSYYNRFEYPEPEVLRIYFEPDSVLRLVNRAGLPLWSANRPQMLGWIVVRRGSGREIVHGEHPLAEAMLEAARGRGMPLRLPLMDLQDQINVNEGAVWGRLSSVLRPATERYGADFIMVGRLTETASGAYDGNFEIWMKREELSLEMEQVTFEEAGEGAVAWVAGELSARYAVRNAKAGQIHLSVTGIDAIKAFSDLLDYLARLDFVTDYGLLAMSAHTVTVGILTRADQEQFLDLLERDGQLKRDQDEPFGARVVWQR
ncbi:MAG: DUF2066 domain-containing protein [Pseudomonadales bacterium]|nr:DUF2066 domain-containing protein [Pseudomonadales bacterium]